MLDLSKEFHPYPKPSQREKPREKPVRVAKARSRPNPRNQGRHAKEWARAYGSVERVKFVAELSCIACGKHKHPSQNSHICNGGLNRKADADKVVPCCLKHHEELDEGNGRPAFELKYKLSLEECAAETQRAWLQHQLNGE